MLTTAESVLVVICNVEAVVKVSISFTNVCTSNFVHIRKDLKIDC